MVKILNCYLQIQIDSLCYSIKTKDFYSDVRNNVFFDFSDYPTNHPNFNNDNKKVVGKFKDETNGIPIVEFVGLRPKMYSILLEDNTEKHTAKGIPHRISQKHLEYKNVLFSGSSTSVNFNSIASKNHQVKSVNINKINLSAFDDKRKLADDGITSYPYGYYNN